MMMSRESYQVLEARGVEITFCLGADVNFTSQGWPLVRRKILELILYSWITLRTLYFSILCLDQSDDQVTKLLYRNEQHNPKPIINNKQSTQLLTVALISTQKKDKMYSAAVYIIHMSHIEHSLKYLFYLTFVFNGHDLYCNTAAEPRGWLNLILYPKT